MRTSLQFRMQQQVAMTPQLQQAIRLLHLALPDLEQEISQMLEQNPFLETEEEAEEASASQEETTESEETTQETLADVADDDRRDIDFDWPNSKSSHDHDHDFEPQDVYLQGTSLESHLLWQLNLTPFSMRDRMVAVAIIESINENGYLAADLNDIAEAVPEIDLETDEILAVLHRIQQFDPVGVGARDLKECLLVQARAFYAQDSAFQAICEMITQHLDKIAKQQYTQLKHILKIDHETLIHAIDCIKQLNPKPGIAINNTPVEVIIPDLMALKRNQQWIAILNDKCVPRLRIQPNYEVLMKQADATQNSSHLKNHLQEAKWFIKCIENRNQTLLKVAQCIIDNQKEFFELGDVAMKPMILSDIALQVGMHESTISRVTSRKYVHTPRGVFELKHFFSSHVDRHDGSECSSTAIRALIKKMVSQENRSSPLSDQQISEQLKKEGIAVARRTIAKYREMLGILSSAERRLIKSS